MNFYEKDERNESLKNYILRLADLKKEHKEITWQGIADSLPKNFNIFKSEAWVRKVVRDNTEKLDTQNLSYIDNDVTFEIDDKILELKKERVKLQEERTQNNAYVRRLSREETILEIANNFADKMSSKKLLPIRTLHSKTPSCKEGGAKEAILCLSDWHYGIECDNYWNKYNPDIARERIAKLLDETIHYIKENNVDTIHVLNLGDLIAGRIHLTLRLESRFDVITQIMEVSEILAEFLNELANNVEIIEYYSCIDNHSRLEPNKNDSLDLESLCRITDWYLKRRLESRNNISINDNIYGDDIITFNTMNYNIAAIHGDKDKNTIATIDSISRMTEDHYDLILTAHLHHFSAEEKNRTVILANGCIMGTDSYAKNLRLSSFPSQNLIIVSEKSPCEAIYRIKL